MNPKEPWSTSIPVETCKYLWLQEIDILKYQKRTPKYFQIPMAR